MKAKPVRGSRERESTVKRKVDQPSEVKSVDEDLEQDMPTEESPLLLSVNNSNKNKISNTNAANANSNGNGNDDNNSRQRTLSDTQKIPDSISESNAVLRAKKFGRPIFPVNGTSHKSKDQESDDTQSSTLPTFCTQMQEGIKVSLHTINHEKGPKEIILSIVGDELQWHQVNKSKTKIQKWPLKNILYVTPGKQSSNFRLIHTAIDAQCFSLITQEYSLDIETKSKIERDALVKGFELKLQNVHYS